MLQWRSRWRGLLDRAVAVFVFLFIAGAALAEDASRPRSADDLWRLPDPPFKVISDGFFSPLVADDAAWEESLEFYLSPLPGFESVWAPDGGISRRYKPARQATAERIAGLEAAGTHIARRFSALSLRAPRLEIGPDAAFPIYLVERLGGGAGALYGPGSHRMSQSDMNRIKGRNLWPRTLSVDEADGFSRDLSIYPEKALVNLGHELFHSIQAAYANWCVHDNRDPDCLWVSEAMAEAMGLYGTQGVSFLGNPAFVWQKRARSGSSRFAKLVGMRPYDYPLDLREEPKTMRLFGAGKTSSDNRRLASYLTSSFWRFVWSESMPSGRAWTPLPRVLALRTPQQPTRNAREASLAWANETISLYHPAWKRGLYDAFPAFVAHWVEYPDQILRSREGVFAHPVWLEHAFEDGCPLIELDVDNPTMINVTTIRPLAATCLRIRWNGPVFEGSGWPGFAMVARSLDKDANVASGPDAPMRSLHIGLRGTRIGSGRHYVDQSTGKAMIAWGAVRIDPLNPSHTNREAILTFSNVAPNPLDTRTRQYEIEIGVSQVTASGVLVTRPQDDTPSSRAQLKPARRLHPGMPAPGRPSLAAGTERIEGQDDCKNASIKIAGDVVLAGNNRITEEPPQDFTGICLRLLRSSDGPPNDVDATLILPAIETGSVGAVTGARLNVYWRDPALPAPDDAVAGGTEDVTVDVESATAGVVKGRFTARFNGESAQSWITGTVTGEFVSWRANVERRASHPAPDALDRVSTDLILLTANMGRDPLELRQMGKGGEGDRAGDGSPDAPVADVSESGSASGVKEGAPACRCNEAEFGPLEPEIPASRQRCNESCRGYSSAARWVRALEESRGRPTRDLVQAMSECPKDCGEMQAPDLTPFCRDMFWPLRQVCARRAVGD